MVAPPLASRWGELTEAIAAAEAAGEAILAILETSYEVRLKSGGDPLTEADLTADRLIRERLTSSFPTYGWISEEQDCHDDMSEGRPVWVVDPLDGTREFVRGIPEFATSIALLTDGGPVVAVCNNPAKGRLITAIRGAAQADRIARRVTDTIDLQRALILASRTETARGLWDDFAGRFAVLATGSVAYKMALVAAGEADATFSLAPKHIWDIAAGVLLVEEAGGRVTDLEGCPIRFEQPDALVDGVIASNGLLHGPLLDLISALDR